MGGAAFLGGLGFRKGIWLAEPHLPRRLEDSPACLYLGNVMQSPFEILFEDNHCLAINKPAGALTTHYQGEEETLDRDVKRYLKEKYAKPGNVYLGIVHRLDRPASGVLLFARTSKAAARLAEQFRNNLVRKTYWAIVEGRVRPESGSLVDWLKKNAGARKVEAVEPHAPQARQAVLNYATHACAGGLSWLDLFPRTGRRHQLRVQLARLGHAIYGDTKYGSRYTLGRAIALHARELTFSHPISRRPIMLIADLPPEWKRTFGDLLRGLKE